MTPNEKNMVASTMINSHASGAHGGVKTAAISGNKWLMLHTCQCDKLTQPTATGVSL